VQLILLLFRIAINLKKKRVRFLLIDESIVSHGFWVDVSGIDLAQFKINPVMYWMHQRASMWDGKNQVFPIGKWDDIKVEQIKGLKAITAEAVFDENDEFALKIKSKVEGGFIKMASAGLMPITFSDEPKYLKPGQSRATVLKSEMLEASIVDRGANKNAVRLYSGEGFINLSEDNSNFVPKINLKSNTDMKTIALKLGLDENSTETEILTEIVKLKESENKSKETIVRLNEEKINNLMQHKSINDDNREIFKNLAKADYSLAEKTLGLLLAKNEDKSSAKEERLSDFIKKSKSHLDIKTSEKKWDDYSEKELIEMREKKPDDYEALFEAEYGVIPILD